MKLNRSQFKKILKECIRELIDEGAFNSVITENVSHAPHAGPTRPAANDFASQFNPTAPQGVVGQPQNTHGSEEQSSPYQPSFGDVGHMSPNERLRELARTAAAATSKGDKKQAKVMENIFADTAMTTLQSQLGNEMGGGGTGGSNGVYIGEQASKEDEEFDQAQIQALNGNKDASHWAKLAFGHYEKK